MSMGFCIKFPAFVLFFIYNYIHKTFLWNWRKNHVCDRHDKTKQTLAFLTESEPNLLQRQHT
jgi:hypothetical protein